MIDARLLQVASNAELKEYEQLLKARTALATPLDYALYTNPKAKRFRHTEFLNNVAMALFEKRLYKSGPGPASIVVDVSEEEPEGRRVHPVTGEPVLSKVMSSMAPRTGKSWFLGEHMTAYYLTTHPDDTIMYISYASKLAVRFSRLARTHILEHPELGVMLDPTSQSVEEWKLENHAGAFVARGIGGIPTGYGGNLLIDDPFQDGTEAMSDDRREYVYEQYVSSLLTRVESGCWIWLNATRWHEDDLHGRLLEAEGDEWFVVNIPAISFDTADAEGYSVDPDTLERDVLGRKPGQAVEPKIATAAYYLNRKKISPFWYDAQYLGKPSGVSGGLFKEFAYYKKHQELNGDINYQLFLEDGTSKFIAENDCVRFATVDLATSQKQSADYTVMSIFDLDSDRNILVREVIQVHIPAFEHLSFINRTATAWNVQVVGVEEVTYGLDVIQDAIANGSSVPIWPLQAKGDKKQRAIPAAVLASKKKLFVDRDAAWRGVFETELKKFDKYPHDDIVDTVAYAAVMRNLLKERKPPKQKAKPKTFEEKVTILSDRPNVPVIKSWEYGDV